MLYSNKILRPLGKKYLIDFDECCKGCKAPIIMVSTTMAMIYGNSNPEVILDVLVDV